MLWTKGAARFTVGQYLGISIASWREMLLGRPRPPPKPDDWLLIVRILVPIAMNCLRASFWMILPTETMAITDPIPMVIPMTASRVRCLAE